MASETSAMGSRRIDWTSKEAIARVKRRNGANLRMQAVGAAAILTACVLLVILIGSITSKGVKAFTQTHVTYKVYLDPAEIDVKALDDADWRGVVRNGFYNMFPEVTARADKRELSEILSNDAQYILRDAVKKDPTLVGKVIKFTTPVSDIYDQFEKGDITRAIPVAERPRGMSDQNMDWYESLQKRPDTISRPFNSALFLNGDSTLPERAGLLPALTGSFYSLLVCFLVAFPLGIAAAVYLEEFAPKNRFTDLIEVNINNLAAVPSIVFGLLGLAVFLNTLNLPRSSSLVGGLVLALLVMPTIIIATRASLKSVPPSIREAALGVGASKHQTIFDHVVPLAMPGILTGAIIGLAHALGETAPLLLIGMKAFLTTPPADITSPATALPAVIFGWSDMPERGFQSRTSAAIIVLLGFLVLMNAMAVFLRARFERKW